MVEPVTIQDMEIIKHLRSGDVLWVRLRDDVTEGDMSDVRDIIQRTVNEISVGDVGVIVTKNDFISELRSATFAELIKLHKQLDDIIIDKVKNRLSAVRSCITS